MEEKSSPSNGGPEIPAAISAAHVVSKARHRSLPYSKVFDERKRPIRGLWVRNGRYYAQLTIEDEHTGRKQVRRVPLEGAATPAQARQQLEDLMVNWSAVTRCGLR